MYALSKRSENNLIGVHPDLQKVVRLAITLTPIDFGISEGLRLEKRQEGLFARGKSTTMDSNHLVQHDGFGHAVDMFVLPDGSISWEAEDFRQVIQAFFEAATQLHIQIKSGGLFRSFQDSPHIELNRKYYD